MYIKNKKVINIAYAGLTSIFLAPFFFQLIHIDFTEFVIEDLVNYFYPYIIGLLFFLPWFLFLILGLFLFEKFTGRFLYKKIFLLIINIIIVFVFFYLISGDTLIYNIDILISFLAISTIALLLFYRN